MSRLSNIDAAARRAAIVRHWQRTRDLGAVAKAAGVSVPVARYHLKVAGVSVSTRVPARAPSPEARREDILERATGVAHGPAPGAAHARSAWRAKAEAGSRRLLAALEVYFARHHPETAARLFGGAR